MAMPLMQRIGPSLLFLGGLAVLAAYTRFHLSRVPRVSLHASVMEDSRAGGQTLHWAP